jgi:hypothetical protein
MNTKTTSARLVREWARDNYPEPVSDRGAIPKRVRVAYAEAHMDANAYVVYSWHHYAAFADERLIYVMCPICTHIHQHGASTGRRGILGHKIRHCWDPLVKRTSYYVEDNTPLAEWEQRFLDAQH